MDNFNKLNWLADKVYGKIPDDARKATIQKGSAGNYYVVWLENGFEKAEALTPEEYLTLLKIGNERMKMWEENRITRANEEKERQKELEEKDYFEKSAQRKAEKAAALEEDMKSVPRLKALVEQINKDYYIDGKAPKVVRDYEELMNGVCELKTPSLRSEILLSLVFNKNKSSENLYEKSDRAIENLKEKIADRPQHYKEVDLRRAKNQAKRRYQEQTALWKITHLKEKMAIDKMTNPGEIDAMFQEGNIIYEGESINGRAR